MNFSEISLPQDNSPRLLKNVVVFGLGIGLVILALNWWFFLKVGDERELHRTLLQEMLSLEKDVSQVVLQERDIINQLLEKNEMGAEAPEPPDFPALSDKYLHLATKTETGVFLEDFKTALQQLVGNRAAIADWSHRYNQLARENTTVVAVTHSALASIQETLAALETALRENPDERQGRPSAKAAGKDKALLIQGRAGNEISATLSVIRHDMGSLALLCELMAVEGDPDRLDGIEANHIRKLLAEITKRMAFLERQAAGDLTSVVRQLDRFVIGFWGENYRKGPAGEIVAPGVGGYYNFHRQRIILLREHDRLRHHAAEDLMNIQVAQRNLTDNAVKYLDKMRLGVESSVQRTWWIVVSASLAMAVFFVLFSRRVVEICQRRIAERNIIISEVGNSNNMLDLVFQTVGNGMRIIDKDFNVVKVNDVFAELVGAEKKSLEGRRCFDEFPGHLCHTEECPVLLLQDGRSRVERDVEKIRTDGKTITCRLRATALRDEQGEFLGVVEDFHDISEMVHAQKTLLKAKEDAEAANEIKSGFLANMSHEIRTPLNGIMGMTDLVLNTELAVDQRRYLGMVKASAGRLLDVVNEVLDFAKIESGSMEIEHIPFNLTDVVSNSLNIQAFKAHDKGLQLSYDIEHDLLDGFIGDPGRLRQILVSLVGNGIKFTKAGKILVTVKSAGSDVCSEKVKKNMGQRDIALHFIVSDTGIGIAPEMQEKIFRAFSQVDGSPSRSHGGAGLGLTICAELITMMGGEIWLQSQVDVGTSFHFVLVLQTQSVQGREYNPAPVRDLSGVSFLVVAGEISGRFVLKEMLNDWAKNVQIANSVEDAQRMAAERHFNVIILDSSAENDYLFKVAAQLHELDTHARIILLTAAGRRGDAQRCKEVGIASYLLKPVGKGELLKAVRMILGNQGSTDAGEKLVTRHTIRESLQILHVLLAEDDEINRVLAVEMLRAQGWRVTTAENGRQVLDALQNDSFHVVLMDIQMPEMDGFEAVSRIRRQDRRNNSHTPVIALTAHALTIDRRKCLDAGMDGYVPKPLDMKILTREIDKVLGRDPSMKTVSLSPVKKGIEVIDYDTFLYDSCNGKTALAGKLIKHLLHVSAPQWIEEAGAAVAAQDETRIRKVSHSIKGTSATVCAHALSKAGEELGKLAREGRMEETPAGLENLKKEYTRLLEWAGSTDLDLV